MANIKTRELTNEQVNRIFECGRNFQLTGENNLKELLDSFDSKPKEEEPVLIGYLARKMGYNGFKTLEIGTPIYSFQGNYFMDMEKESDGTILRQKYYPHSFTDDEINFIVRETKFSLSRIRIYENIQIIGNSFG